MPQPQKRPRPEYTTDNGDRERVNASVGGLSSLARELKHIIVELACSRGRYDDDGLAPASSKSSLPDLDAPTLLNLTLVNRELHQLSQQLQYRSIEIATPSALYELYRTLWDRPDLAALIRSLHIGPQGALPRSWWPLSFHLYKSEQSLVQSKLMSSLPRHLLPKAGHRSTLAWPISASGTTCIEAAVRIALQVALKSVDAGLIRKVRGRLTGVVEHTFAFQAILDLYLLEIRRREDAGTDFENTSRRSSRLTYPPVVCINGKCGHYPPLRVVEFPAQPSSSACSRLDPVEITRSQIQHHLMQRGSGTDRFDHPLLFSRSGLSMRWGGEDGQAYNVIHDGWVEGPGFQTQWSKEARIDLSAFLCKGCQEENNESPADDSSATQRATLKSTLSWARSVLNHATNVENLSLTGHFEQVTRSGLELPSVKKCTLGPPPAFLMLTELDLSCLPNVEQLRRCGTYISHAEAQCIRERMPRLKRMVWSVLTYQGREVKFDCGGRPRPSQGLDGRLVAAIGRLLKYGHAAADSDDGASGEESGPLVEVRLHYTDLGNTFALKPDWVEAQPFREPGRRGQLLLTESAAAQDIPIESIDEETSRLWEVHYEEGREWWSGNAK